MMNHETHNLDSRNELPASTDQEIEEACDALSKMHRVVSSLPSSEDLIRDQRADAANRKLAH